MSQDCFDVVIVGAGCIGNLMANLLVAEQKQANKNLRIALIDKNTPQAFDQEFFSPRVYAINHATKALLERVGVWANIATQRYCAYENMRVWQDELNTGLAFSASDEGLENLGYIIEHDYLNWHLYQQLEHNVTHILADVEALDVQADVAQIKLKDQTLQAKLIIAADGANSSIRRLANFASDQSAYQQTALVANVKLDHANQQTAYQRFLPTGPLAFLPLANNDYSIVWSLPTQLAEQYAKLNQSAFASTLLSQCAQIATTLTLSSEIQSFPLKHLSVEQYVKPRIALLGDAAHVVHPLAGQGLNLGARDCWALTKLLCESQIKSQDIGVLANLHKYQRAVKPFNQIMANSFALLNNMFANDQPVLSKIRQTGLQLVNSNDLLKSVFIQQAVAAI